MPSVQTALITPPGQSVTTSLGIGFIIADENLRPLYIDEDSRRILTYPSDEPEPSNWSVEMQGHLRRVLGADKRKRESSLTVFLSGRRRYWCRTCVLRSCLEGAGAPAIAVLLERQHSGWSTALSDASRRFSLSQRETETVQHLVHGLTTKEIASRMNVSPNTVKQFIRLIMSKMAVSTRAGVLGKIARYP
jgi:DNA-binding CsgD family transcriptional regulator